MFFYSASLVLQSTLNLFFICACITVRTRFVSEIIADVVLIPVSPPASPPLSRLDCCLAITLVVKDLGLVLLITVHKGVYFTQYLL